MLLYHTYHTHLPVTITFAHSWYNTAYEGVSSDPVVIVIVRHKKAMLLQGYFLPRLCANFLFLLLIIVTAITFIHSISILASPNSSHNKLAKIQMLPQRNI